jgi:hypothetical protein
MNVSCKRRYVRTGKARFLCLALLLNYDMKEVETRIIMEQYWSDNKGTRILATFSVAMEKFKNSE